LARRLSDSPHAPIPLTILDDPYAACVVSSWGQWGRCSAKCGGGKVTRSRTVTSQGSGNCPSLTLTQSCNNEPCSYDRSAAVRLLYFAYASYCPASAVQAWTCQHCQESGFKVLSLLSDTGKNTFGYVGYSSKLNEIIVAFRGTVSSSIKNWVEDLSAFKGWSDVDGISDARAESGFESAYKPLKPQMLSAVSAAVQQYPTASITVTGHSLGGAMSTLAAVDLTQGEGYSDITHYTFGSPRTGNPTFASAYQSLVGSGQRIRVVNNNDLVPHVPLEDFGYEHVAQEIWLHNGGTVVCSTTNGEDPNGSDSLSLLQAISIPDHLNYFGIKLTC